MQFFVQLVCLSLLATGVHCYGSAGSGYQTTVTTTKAIEPMITASPYVFQNLKGNATLVLEWSKVIHSPYISPDPLMMFSLTASYPGDDAQLGWIAVGWSPDGRMGSGDYVMGYQEGGFAEGCVRALTNQGVGSAPAGKSFKLFEPSLTVEGKNMTLIFTRPINAKNSLTDAGNHVLVAAGSTKSTPASCDTALSLQNHHDMGIIGSEKFRLIPSNEVVV